jgi:hypothetical protein
LIKLSLEGSRIDLRQHIPGFDVLTLGEIHLGELTIHARFHRHCIKGLDDAEAGQIDRDIRGCRLTCGDRDGR